MSWFKLIKIVYNIIKNVVFSQTVLIGSKAGESILVYPGEDLIFTAAIGTPGIFTSIGHLFDTGFKCTVSSAGTLPPELSPGVDYWIDVIDPDTFYLCPTSDDAINGTNRIDISGAGTGTHTLNTIDRGSIFLSSFGSEEAAGTRQDPVNSIISAKNIAFLDDRKYNFHLLTAVENHLFYLLRIFLPNSKIANGYSIEGDQLSLSWQDKIDFEDQMQVSIDYGFSIGSDVTYSHLSPSKDVFWIDGGFFQDQNRLPLAYIDTHHQGRWFTRYNSDTDQFELYWDRGNGYKFVTSQPRFALEQSASGQAITRYEYRILDCGDWVLCGMTDAVSGSINTKTATGVGAIIGAAKNQFFETKFDTTTITTGLGGVPVQIAYNVGGTAFQVSVAVALDASIASIIHYSYSTIPDSSWFRNAQQTAVAATPDNRYFTYSSLNLQLSPTQWILLADSALFQTDEARPGFLSENSSIGVDPGFGIICSNLVARNIAITVDKLFTTSVEFLAGTTKPFAPDGQYGRSTINYIGKGEATSVFTCKQRQTAHYLSSNTRESIKNELFNFDYMKLNQASRSAIAYVALIEWQAGGAQYADFCTMYIIDSLTGAVNLIFQNSVLHTITADNTLALNTCVHFNVLPDAAGVNNVEADPLFVSILNPINLRLRSVDGGFGIDSPAYLYVSSPPTFENAGAYDDTATTTESSDFIVLPVPDDFSAQLKGEGFKTNDIADSIEADDRAITCSLKYAWKIQKMPTQFRKLILDLYWAPPAVRIYHDPENAPNAAISAVLLRSAPVDLGNDDFALNNSPAQIQMSFEARLTKQLFETLQINGWFI